MTAVTAELARTLVDVGRRISERTAGAVVEKAKHDYLSDADRDADAHLTRALDALTPGVPVLSEERDIDPWVAGGEFWLVDPVDGTHNFIAGIPFFTVCAALFRGGEVAVSAVLDVPRGAVYAAELGRGATLDGEPLRIPERAPTLIGLSTGALDALVRRPGSWDAVREIGRVRNLGCQSLHICGVARGQMAFAASAEARIWDDAAARLVAEEAGARYVSLSVALEGSRGLATALAGESLRSLCAHPRLADRVERLFRAVWAE